MYLLLTQQQVKRELRALPVVGTATNKKFHSSFVFAKRMSKVKMLNVDELTELMPFTNKSVVEVHSLVLFRRTHPRVAKAQGAGTCSIVLL